MHQLQKTVILLDYRCNNRCIFCCYENKLSSICRSAEDIKSEIRHARNNGSTYVEFIGGEPTINPGLPFFIKYAGDMGFNDIVFSTNGRMLSYKDYADRILESGVTEIIFSIHGHRDDIHDFHTSTKNSFKQLLKGIENIRNSGNVRIASNTVITSYNYKLLPETGIFIRSLGIRNSEFIFIDPVRGGALNRFEELVPHYGETSPYINELLEIGFRFPHWHVRYYLLCFLKKRFHKRFSEYHEKLFFKTKHIAPDFINNEVSYNRMNFARTTNLPWCEGCKYIGLCEGPWKKYVEKREHEFNKKRTVFLDKGFNILRKRG